MEWPAGLKAGYVKNLIDSPGYFMYGMSPQFMAMKNVGEVLVPVNLSAFYLKRIDNNPKIHLRVGFQNVLIDVGGVNTLLLLLVREPENEQKKRDEYNAGAYAE
jgi:hypothetical protein